MAARKPERRPPEPLEPNEVKRLIAAASGRAPTGIRNRALIALLYRSGLRVSEALALTARDLNGEDESIRVRHGKGDRARTVPLDPDGWNALRPWLDKRRALGLDKPRTRIFCTLDGKPLQTAYVRAMFKRLGERAGIEKRVHAHGLRHTYARELFREGAALGDVQALLGHARVEQTARYMRHIGALSGATVSLIRRRSMDKAGQRVEPPASVDAIAALERTLREVFDATAVLSAEQRQKFLDALSGAAARPRVVAHRRAEKRK